MRSELAIDCCRDADAPLVSANDFDEPSDRGGAGLA